MWVPISSGFRMVPTKGDDGHQLTAWYQEFCLPTPTPFTRVWGWSGHGGDVRDKECCSGPWSLTNVECCMYVSVNHLSKERQLAHHRGLDTSMNDLAQCLPSRESCQTRPPSQGEPGASPSTAVHSSPLLWTITVRNTNGQAVPCMSQAFRTIHDTDAFNIHQVGCLYRCNGLLDILEKYQGTTHDHSNYCQN